ncbi:hypothetical protein KKF70_02010 [bacterium]|nr:hypothetical protein [Candidatus Omnitrophota bacterium]MBU2528148.1 hypothetical protein [bacterium]MBU3929526.1 hypothetical protein [bacterium]MBU4122295.1 hypothetical protein [bacterium]
MKITNSYFAAAALTILLAAAGARADINTGLDIRGRAFGSDTLSGSGGKISYFEQRSRFYFEGMLQKDVKANVTLRNNGVWGRSGEDELFLDRAYISAGGLMGLPLEASLGRQGCKLGDGLLINDDETGLSGVKFNASLPWGFKATGAAFKLIEASSASFAGGDSDRDISFFSLSRNALNGKATLTYFSDYDRTLSSATELSMMDIRYESGKDREVQWVFEYAKSGGSGVDTSAVLARTTAYGDIYKLGEGNAFILFADAKEHFNTGAAFINEEENFGEYYIRNRENGRENSLENLRILGAGFKSSVMNKPMKLLFNYFTYELSAVDVQGMKELGKEMDIGLEYARTKNLDFRLIYSSFSRGEALSVTGGKVTQILFETNLNF